MAGAGKKTFVNGDVLTASQVNTYLMDQSVMRFASATARTTAIASPDEGMMSYLDDVNRVDYYNGSAWVPLAGQMPRAELTLTTDFTHPSTGAWVTITGWTSTEVRGGFSVASSVITVPLAGRYMITANVGWAANGTGARIIGIAKGGTTVTSPGTFAATPSASLPLPQNITHVLTLAANDTIRLMGYQNSGATLAVGGSSYGSGAKFIIEYLGV